MTDIKPPSYKPRRVISCEEILKIIPHRYPFLLVDKVEIIEENKSCVGTKCVIANELYFHGHFPAKPILPGVLILEAMAQTAASMMMSLPETRGHFAYIAIAKGFEWKYSDSQPGDANGTFAVGDKTDNQRTKSHSGG